MAELNWTLLPWQKEVWKDPNRFKIIVAGRRTGKSNFSIKQTIAAALEAPKGSAVVYVAPTQSQCRQIAWDALLDQGREVIKSAHVNSLDITLVTGAKIHLRSAENPDTLRGLKLYFAVLDEAAFMKDEGIWTKIIRPALSDLKGKALFISSPSGRNWFFDLYMSAKNGDKKDWSAYHKTTFDNPTIDPEEIAAAKENLSSFAFRQEFMASFDSQGSDVFKSEWIKYGSEPKEGDFYIAGDLAGFADLTKMYDSNVAKLDYTSFAVVKVNTDGWWVAEVKYGRWGVKETAQILFDLVEEYRPIRVGLERGTSKNAVMPYLLDLMKIKNIFFGIEELTHGNQRKIDRVIWSLQGRFEHGRITLNKGDWNTEFLDQLFQFPNKRVHDDLPDSLSYIDQVAKIAYAIDIEADEYEILDMVSGY